MNRAGDLLPLLDPDWGAPEKPAIDNDIEGDGGKASKEERLKWFEHFWAEAVWAKIGIGAARASFCRKAKDVETARLIFRAAKRQTPQIMARAAESTNGTPVHPSTWLNQERYLDEDYTLPAATNGRRPSVVAVDPAELERQRREITPEVAERIGREVLRKWVAEYRASAADPAWQRWILEQFPEVRAEVEE